MRAGGKPEDVAVAQKNLESSVAILTAAQSRLESLHAGARPEEVEVARSAVDEAQAHVDMARANVAGTSSAIEAATAAVTAAKAAADAALKNVEVAKASLVQRTEEVKLAGGKGIELAVAEKLLEIGRLNVKALEQQIEDARIRAPFDGVVRELLVKAGDQVQAYGPIGTLADPAKLELTLDVPAADLSKITLGQAATVAVDPAGSRTVTEKVIGLPLGGAPLATGASTATETRPVRISLTGLPEGFALGVAANISIVTRLRDSALLVPAAAVKKFGGRKLVQVVGPDGRRRDVEVDTGIQTDTEVEILEGLTEGQAVVAS